MQRGHVIPTTNKFLESDACCFLLVRWWRWWAEGPTHSSLSLLYVPRTLLALAWPLLVASENRWTELWGSSSQPPLHEFLKLILVLGAF